MRIALFAIFFTAGLILPALLAFGADDTPSKEWGGTVEFGLITATGNSRTQTARAQAKAVKKTSRERWILQGGGLTSESDGDKGAENYYANGAYHYIHTPKTYSTYYLGWEKDKQAGLDARLTARVGLGHEFVKTGKDFFTGEAGAGYVYENDFEGTQGYPEGRLFGRYEHYFQEDATFFQELEWLQDLGMLRNWRVNSITGLKLAINKTWSLKTALTIRYDHEPPVGFRKSDTITETVLVYEF